MLLLLYSLLTRWCVTGAAERIKIEPDAPEGAFMLLSTKDYRLPPIRFYLCDEEDNITGKGQDGLPTRVDVVMTPHLRGAGCFRLTKEFQAADDVILQLPHTLRGEETEAFEGLKIVESTVEEGRSTGHAHKQKLILRFSILNKAQNAPGMIIAGKDELEFEIIDDKAQEESLRVLQEEKTRESKRAAQLKKSCDKLKQEVDLKCAEYLEIRRGLLQSCGSVASSGSPAREVLSRAVDALPER